MKIGFDAKRLFHNFTGLGNYSRSLVKNLHRYTEEELELHLYSPRLSEHQRVQEFLNTPAYSVHDKGQNSSILWRSSGIKKDLKQTGIDIYHGLSHELPIGIKGTGIKTVVSMHDLIFLTYPSYYSFIDRQVYNWKFAYAAKHADRVLAISESTKKDLIHYYQTAPEKIEVLYQACDEQFYEKKTPVEIQACQKRHKLPESYLLYVGSIIERKNLLQIVKAIELLPTSLKVPLVILGHGKAYLEKVRTYIARKGMESLFVFCEQVPFSDFPAIYQQARMFIYPSFYEGFGIPIIEALWSETPVISANTSSLPEAGGPDSLYIDPNEPAELADAIEKILTDDQLSQEMSLAGKAYVQKFHGRSLSQELVKIYKSL